MLSEQEDHDASQGLAQNILSTVVWKSVGSPYSRLQLILQNQTYLRNIGLLPESIQNINSTQISLGSLTSYLYKNEGIMSYWRGHSMTLLKAIGQTILSYLLKPHLNQILGIASRAGDKQQQQQQQSNNKSNKYNKRKSVDDPSLAHTEVPALLDIITRHQSNMNTNTNVNVAPKMFSPPSKVPSKRAASNNNENDEMNDDDNNNENDNYSNKPNSLNLSRGKIERREISMFEKVLRFGKKHLAREIYPLLSLVLLYPLSVFQTYFWLDLKGTNTNGVDYSFNNGYIECYKQLGGNFKVIYGGLTAAVIGSLIYRQTYFNMYHIIDWVLYKITGKKRIKVNETPKKITNNKNNEQQMNEEMLFKTLNTSLRGIITTNIALFMAFPFQVIKYRMILSKHPNSNVEYNGLKDCIVQTIGNDGYKAFFNGAIANLALGIVAGIALITVDVTKMAQTAKAQKQRQRNLMRIRT